MLAWRSGLELFALQNLVLKDSQVNAGTMQADNAFQRVIQINVIFDFNPCSRTDQAIRLRKPAVAKGLHFVGHQATFKITVDNAN
jgi:hypothetical protein